MAEEKKEILTEERARRHQAESRQAAAEREKREVEMHQESPVSVDP